MKIQFINKNDSKAKPEKIDSFCLSKNNPRYTLLDSINKDLYKFIIGENEEDDEFEKIPVYIQLLMREGDFSDLLNLLKSIDDLGFDNENDPLYVVDSLSESKFTVAEGNRRLMCLNLIDNNFELPDFDELNKISVTYANEKTNQIEEQESEENDNLLDKTNNEKIKKNYEECRKIIGNIIESNVEIKCYFEVVTNHSDAIWKSIYDKHLTGEKPGLRKWSRSKYFADLISMFPNGINEKHDNRDFRLKIKRDFRQIKADYKNALLIYSIIYAGKGYEFDDSQNIVDFKQKSIINRMIGLERVSALEKMHSFAKIVKYACEILKITRKQFEQEYFSFKYENNCLIRFYPISIETKSILKFIYDQWTKGVITTRPIKSECEKDFKNDLQLILFGQKVRKHLTEEELDQIEEFSLTISSLEDLINANEHYYENEMGLLRRFKLCLSVKKNNLKLIKLKDKIFPEYKNEPKYVFERLWEQLIVIDENFINARAVTMRSILEQLAIWMHYFYSENKDEIVDAMSIMNGYKLSDIREEVFKKMKSDEGEPYILSLIKRFTTVEDLDDKKKIIFLFQRKEKSWSNLNLCIHATHRLFSESDYNRILNKFREYQEIIILILENMKFEEFDELNSKIIDKVNSLKKFSNKNAKN